MAHPDEPLLDAIASLLPSGRRKRHLVGVSGGRDSVVLLHALHALKFSSLVVCHLDHGLRGGSSRGDRAFVGRLARRLGYDCVSERIDVAGIAKGERVSVETAGRQARHALFERVARARRCPRVILGHHGDDLAETFLFNLCRGSGPAGLASMRPRAEVGRLVLLRPLLAVGRREIDAYAARHRVRYREDASNRDPRYTRNRIRHEVIPLLEDVAGREVRLSLRRAAEILRAEEEWMATLPELQLERELPVKALAALPLALQRRRIRAWLADGGVRDLGFDEVERVRTLLEGKGAKVNLPRDRHARRRSGVLFLE